MVEFGIPVYVPMLTSMEEFILLLGHGGALVEATTFDRRIVGSNHAVAAT